MDIQLRYSQSLKPCELQELIPDHKFSFCWIYLLLLTLLTIRFSWPPSYHPLFIIGIPLRWFESYLNGRSFKVAWGGVGRYPQNINWSLWFLRDRLLDPSSSPHTLNQWVPSYKHMVSHTIALLMTHRSISHFDKMIQRYLHGSQAAWRTSRRG